MKVKSMSDYTQKDWDDLRDKVVNKYYETMFERRIGPNQYPEYEEKSFFGGGNEHNYKALIRNLISCKMKIITGYRCSPAGIKGVHEHVVLWKNT